MFNPRFNTCLCFAKIHLLAKLKGFLRPKWSIWWQKALNIIDSFLLKTTDKTTFLHFENAI